VFRPLSSHSRAALGSRYSRDKLSDEFAVSDFYDLSQPGIYTIQASRPDLKSHVMQKSNVITITVTPQRISPQ